MANVALDFDVLDELMYSMTQNAKIPKSDPRHFGYISKPSARSRNSMYPVYYMLNQRYPNLST